MLKKFMKATLIAGLMFGLSAPVVAEEANWSFYGNVRMGVFQEQLTKEKAGDGKADSDFAMGLMSTSRIGAKIQKDKVTALVEYNHAGVLRHFYAQIPLGGGKLLIGQSWCPSVALIVAEQVYANDNALVQRGTFYEGRREQITYSNGGLQVALMQPTTPDPTGSAVDTDVSIPKIEGAFSFGAGPAKITLLAGTQSYKVNTTAKSYSIASTVLGAGIRSAAGPAKISFAMYSAVNSANYGAYTTGNGAATYDAASDSIKNTTAIGYTLAVSASGLHLGYGSESTKEDVTGAKDDVTTGLYVNYPVKLDSGLVITPEAGIHDDAKDENDVKEGSKSYLGAKLQVNF